MYEDIPNIVPDYYLLLIAICAPGMNLSISLVRPSRRVEAMMAGNGNTGDGEDIDARLIEIPDDPVAFRRYLPPPSSSAGDEEGEKDAAGNSASSTPAQSAFCSVHGGGSHVVLNWRRCSSDTNSNRVPTPYVVEAEEEEEEVVSSTPLDEDARQMFTRFEDLWRRTGRGQWWRRLWDGMAKAVGCMLRPVSCCPV